LPGAEAAGDDDDRIRPEAVPHVRP